jgi:MoaA/NifB/PqqE/SkfB family radical SAM enzyme
MSQEPKLSTYFHSKAIAREFPVSGTFELTSRCNFRCEMCYVHDECHNAEALSTEQWLKIAEDAKNAGTLFLLITGGEPLAREDFPILYTEFKKMGFMVSLNTNGSLLHKHFDLFKKYPPVRVNVSLYGADDNTYESLCKIRAFTQVYKNVKTLKEMGISVKFNTIFTIAVFHIMTISLNCYKKFNIRHCQSSKSRLIINITRVHEIKLTWCIEHIFE